MFKHACPHELKHMELKTAGFKSVKKATGGHKYRIDKIDGALISLKNRGEVKERDIAIDKIKDLDASKVNVCLEKLKIVLAGSDVQARYPTTETTSIT